MHCAMLFKHVYAVYLPVATRNNPSLSPVLPSLSPSAAFSLSFCLQPFPLYSLSYFLPPLFHAARLATLPGAAAAVAMSKPAELWDWRSCKSSDQTLAFIAAFCYCLTAIKYKVFYVCETRSGRTTLVLFLAA